MPDNKLDKLLAFGSSFDWLTPMIDLYKDINNGPHHDFYIDRYAGWSGGKIRRLLKKNNINIWGLGYSEHLITLRVKEEQRQEAERVLKQNRIPIL